MSIQAMAWAIEQREVTDPQSRLVLICLANYADAVGANAFPSISRLCGDTGLSESSVRRRLRELEERVMIGRGNQAISAAHIGRADRRPTVYDLIIPRGVSLTPRERNGVSGEPSRGVRKGSTGCQSLTPDPSESVREPKSAKSDYREEFRRRFGHYPTALADSTPAKRARR